MFSGFKFEQLGEGNIQSFGNVDQYVHAAGASGGLDPLEILHGDAVSSHFCQLGLGQLPFLSVVQNIQTDFDPYVVMADVHTITSVPIVNNTPLKIFNLIVLKYK